MNCTEQWKLENNPSKMHEVLPDKWNAFKINKYFPPSFYEKKNQKFSWENRTVNDKLVPSRWKGVSYSLTDIVEIVDKFNKKLNSLDYGSFIYTYQSNYFDLSVLFSVNYLKSKQV